jgi:hypothetical protein
MFSLALLGQIGAVRTRLHSLLEEARDRGNLYAETNLLCSVGYYYGVMDDQPQRSHAEIDDALARWKTQDVSLQMFNACLSHLYLDLYCRDGESAWRRINEAWRSFEEAFFLRVQLLRSTAWSARARAALASAAQGHRERLDIADRDGRRLERERVPYCVATGRLMRAGVAHLRDQPARALTLLEEAEQLFRQADMELSVMVTRWHRGTLMGGSQGTTLVQQADAWFRTEGFTNPAGIAELIAPGFSKA